MYSCENTFELFGSFLQTLEAISFGKQYLHTWAELGQAQLKLGLDFTLIFGRFAFSRICCVDLGFERFTIENLRDLLKMI